MQFKVTKRPKKKSQFFPISDLRNRVRSSMGNLAHLDKMDQGRKNVKITRPDLKPNENYLFNKKQKIDQLGRL